MDKLDEIFDMQRRYTTNAILAEHDNPIRFPVIKQEQMSAIAKGLIHEAVEFDASIPWKWWKKDPNYHTWDIPKSKEELIDAFHFVVAAALFLDMTPDEMLAEYKRKHEINMGRTRSGY